MKAISAEQIANFLVENPSFFEEHPEVLNQLSLPNPNGSGTLSIIERQVLSLRQQMRKLESQYSALWFNADTNDNLLQEFTNWCVSLLQEDNKAQIPSLIESELNKAFKLDVVLRLWGVDSKKHDLSENQEVQDYVKKLEKPYLGTAGLSVVHEWFEDKPGSLAILPLHIQDKCIGVLVFASPDSENFTPKHGTAFLEEIARIASAALTRLLAKK